MGCNGTGVNKMSNTICAIINLINNPQLDLVDYYNNKNRANSTGASLEEYVKDLFAGTMFEDDEIKRDKQIDEVFSYIGSDSKPPDAMLRGGDAIEVKKHETANKDLQLNSSYPKCKLKANSKMISKACKEAEKGDWIKDLLYVVGHVENKQLKSLFMVYGVDYAASDDVYFGVKKEIQDWIKQMEDFEFEETEELARINMIDSLSITKLRVRGMWILQNPWKVFDYEANLDTNKKFEFCAIINKIKYESFPEHKALEDLVGKIEGLAINDIKIKDPNNSEKLIAAKMIRFSI